MKKYFFDMVENAEGKIEKENILFTSFFYFLTKFTKDLFMLHFIQTQDCVAKGRFYLSLQKRIDKIPGKISDTH